MGDERRNEALDAIHVSIDFDKRLWREDLAGSRAHIRMLGEEGIVESGDVETILDGLNRVELELEAGTFPYDRDHEDIHLNIESRLTQLVGTVGGKLHTGRSRNDQVATDLRLWSKAACSRVQGSLQALGHALLELAERELDAQTVLPFYTHLQRAQPVLAAHHLLAHVEAFERDLVRIRAAHACADVSPLGAGAGAGSGFPVDPHRSAELLGFERPCRNSLDGVSARDFVLELLAALSIHMVHLSRLAEELVLWSSQEFGFVRLPNDLTTGSSIMPQKRNPDGAELVRAKSGRVFGHLQALLVTLKALPLAYNKDFQEDKEGLFDAVDTALICLAVMAAMVQGMEFDRERMRHAVCARSGYANATELADYLAARGMPFRQAHGAVRALVDEARAAGKSLEELGLERLRQLSPVVGTDVLEALSVEAAVAKRRAFMGTAYERVEEALVRAKQRWGLT